MFDDDKSRKFTETSGSFPTVPSPENGTGRVTIADVAVAAGVSVPTVSKVINGRADVAPATRARVERLLHVHGYRRRSPRPRPNYLLASSLAS